MLTVLNFLFHFKVSWTILMFFSFYCWKKPNNLLWINKQAPESGLLLAKIPLRCFCMHGAEPTWVGVQSGGCLWAQGAGGKASGARSALCKSVLCSPCRKLLNLHMPITAIWWSYSLILNMHFCKNSLFSIIISFWNPKMACENISLEVQTKARVWFDLPKRVFAWNFK